MMKNMNTALTAHDLSIGYNRKVLIRGIEICLQPGRILTLIGPNGAGKSTFLKTITRQLPPISGKVYVGNLSLSDFSGKDFAKRTAVVLTERIHPELMSCAEVVAMGRYPYTDMFGKLTEQDKAIVKRSLELVHGLELADQQFTTLSDGQKQRILLARAICQEPEIIVLDEPTAYLDIRYKIELLEILRKMAREQGTTVIMSLHEVDLAMKISDEILCLDGETVSAYGTPEDILASGSIEKLYDIRFGSYNPLFGSVELPKTVGNPRVFVIAGNGKGTDFYRMLQKRGIPFATGILFENDVDCQTADVLSDHVIKAPAFEPITAELLNQAKKLLAGCEFLLDAGTKIGELNRANAELLEFAEINQIPVIYNLKGLEKDER